MKLLVIAATLLIAISNVNQGNVTLEQSDVYEDYYIEAEENYVYCSVSAHSLSNDEIVPSTEVLFNGENCAEIVLNLLEDEGLIPEYSGAADEGFYLSSIGGIDTSNLTISSHAIEYLKANDIEYVESVEIDGQLSEFDFTEFSGWVYSVNGEIPSVGMCDYIPEVGDCIELHFTLNYGEDLDL